MGDHRSNSADSRTFGPVEVDQVIGRAWLRYWPLDTFGILAHADLPGDCRRPIPEPCDAPCGTTRTDDAVNPILAVVALAVVGGAVVVVSVAGPADGAPGPAPWRSSLTPARRRPAGRTRSGWPRGSSARSSPPTCCGSSPRDRGGPGVSSPSPTGGSRIGWPAEVLVAAGGGGRRLRRPRARAPRPMGRRWPAPPGSPWRRSPWRRS